MLLFPLFIFIIDPFPQKLLFSRSIATVAQKIGFVRPLREKAPLRAATIRASRGVDGSAVCQ